MRRPSRARTARPTGPVPTPAAGVGATVGVTVAAALVVTLVAGTPVAPALAQPAAAPAAGVSVPEHRPAARTIELGGVTVRLRAGTRQVLTVNATRGWHARVVLWRRTVRHGWTAVTGSSHGRTGYGGLVRAARREQGTGTTPLGTFTVTEAFGLAARPAGTRLPFHRVRQGDYWVQDNRSAYYNQLRNRRQGGFRWRATGYNSSERLTDYPGQYRWSVVIDFNRPRPVRHRGSGIFLHVNGEGATAGCVSTPRAFVRQSLQRLKPRLHPVVAIGR